MFVSFCATRDLTQSINLINILLIDYGVDDTVWSTWSDAQLRAFLVKEKVLSSVDAAKYKRHDLENRVSANWYSAQDNLVAGWKESDMRDWLIQHGYLKSDAQAAKDDVSSLSRYFGPKIRRLKADANLAQIASSFAQHYGKVVNKSSSYLSWSDARIKGWLRSKGVIAPAQSSRDELIASMRSNCENLKNFPPSPYSTFTENLNRRRLDSRRNC